MIPMEYTPMVYSPKGKVMVLSWRYFSIVTPWFYKRFFFKVVMVMVKDKRKYNKKIQCQ